MAAGFVRGVHGQHPRYMRATAGCKHFDVHAGPENIPVPRSSFNAKVKPRYLTKNTHTNAAFFGARVD